MARFSLARIVSKVNQLIFPVPGEANISCPAAFCRYSERPAGFSLTLECGYIYESQQAVLEANLHGFSFGVTPSLEIEFDDFPEDNCTLTLEEFATPLYYAFCMPSNPGPLAAHIVFAGNSYPVSISTNNSNCG